LTHIPLEVKVWGPFACFTRPELKVERGQCFAQPYLGCREFSAFFAEPADDDRPPDLSMGLGRMLLDLDYANDRSGNARPRFFNATLDHGVMRIPRAADETGGRDAA
jgi:CRISPR-associated protein Cas5d